MSEAVDRLNSLLKETPSYEAEDAHLHALVWAMRQLSRDEYFNQDIIDRLHQAQRVMEIEKTDPLIWHDKGIGLSLSDVINDAIFEIKQLRSNR
jgi:hypothetical protein